MVKTHETIGRLRDEGSACWGGQNVLSVLAVCDRAYVSPRPASAQRPARSLLDDASPRDFLPLDPRFFTGRSRSKRILGFEPWTRLVTYSERGSAFQ